MEKKGAGRPRDGNPEETRREILRAAEESFARSGFVGATTRLVAASAGVNVATLHYHFGSKEGLYRAVLRRASEEALPEVPAGGSPAEEVARLVAALYDAGLRRPSFARLALLDSLAGPPAGPAALDPRVPWLAGRLRDCLNGSAAAAPPAEQAARTILTLLDATVATASPASSEEPARNAVVAAALRITGLA